MFSLLTQVPIIHLNLTWLLVNFKELFYTFALCVCSLSRAIHKTPLCDKRRQQVVEQFSRAGPNFSRQTWPSLWRVPVALRRGQVNDKELLQL